LDTADFPDHKFCRSGRNFSQKNEFPGNSIVYNQLENGFNRTVKNPVKNLVVFPAKRLIKCKI